MQNSPDRGTSRARVTAASRAAGLLVVVAGACDRAPEVARPLRPAALDEGISALVDAHVARAAADSGSAALHGELGLVYEANSLWPEARASFASAHALDPGDPSWTLHLAIATMQEGDFEGAVEILRGLAREEPGFAPGRHRLGDALLDTADPSAAKPHFEAAERLAPGSPEGAVGLARVALALDEPADAVRHLERALERDPGHAMAHFLLGQAWRRLGDDAAAERETALGRGARKRFLHDEAGVRAAGYAAGMVAQLSRAKARLEAGEPRAAIEILERANAERPGRPEILNNLAIAYGTVDELPRAIEVLREARRVDGTNALTHLNLAVALLDAGDAGTALASAERAVELEPDSARARFVHGSALLFLGRVEEAYPSLAEASRLSPTDVQARSTLGEACLRLGRLDEAERHLAAVVEAAPGHLRARILLGRLQLARGRLDEARVSLEAARGIAPRDPGVLDLERRLAEREGG